MKVIKMKEKSFKDKFFDKLILGLFLLTYLGTVIWCICVFTVDI